MLSRAIDPNQYLIKDFKALNPPSLKNHTTAFNPFVEKLVEYEGKKNAFKFTLPPLERKNSVSSLCSEGEDSPVNANRIAKTKPTHKPKRPSVALKKIRNDYILQKDALDVSIEINLMDVHRKSKKALIPLETEISKYKSLNELNINTDRLKESPYFDDINFVESLATRRMIKSLNLDQKIPESKPINASPRTKRLLPISEVKKTLLKRSEVNVYKAEAVRANYYGDKY